MKTASTKLNAANATATVRMRLSCLRVGSSESSFSTVKHRSEVAGSWQQPCSGVEDSPENSTSPVWLQLHSCIGISEVSAHYDLDAEQNLQALVSVQTAHHKLPKAHDVQFRTLMLGP